VCGENRGRAEIGGLFGAEVRMIRWGRIHREVPGALRMHRGPGCCPEQTLMMQRRRRLRQQSGVDDERVALREPERVRCRALSRSRQKPRGPEPGPTPQGHRLCGGGEQGVWVLRQQIRNGPLHGGEDAGWFLRNRNGWLA
jgi:hypothetical protein